MALNTDYTTGSITRGMLRFSVPYLVSCFLQTFYGMADLFITGQFHTSGTITAVAVGSQIMHMLTVMLVGLAMGTTVTISLARGAKDERTVSESIFSSAGIFAAAAFVLTGILLLCVDSILRAVATPEEAFSEARRYLIPCFCGIPFITAYNVLGSIFRGCGDTKRPMVFVAVSGVVNIGLDYLFIGPWNMGAAGAAYATVLSQILAAALALVSLKHHAAELGIRRESLRMKKEMCRKILGIGIPVSLQDGFIQVSFLVITAIANARGVDVAAAVGIVEKIVSFLFLVPSAMLSTVSALAAQNAGAGQHGRGREVLKNGIRICVLFGAAVFLVCQAVSPAVVGLFVRSGGTVVVLGAQYLRSYTLDVLFGGIQFSFSGYFSAYGRSGYSFLHNVLAILLVRIPGAYLASVYFPETLYPLGFAPALGSVLSTVICVILFRRGRSRGYWDR